MNSCASCTALLQLGLSLTRQGERLTNYSRRLADWQAASQEHLATHTSEDARR